MNPKTMSHKISRTLKSSEIPKPPNAEWYRIILAIFYPPLKQIWGCFGLFLQAQKGEREIPISQNWLKGQNMATAHGQGMPRRAVRARGISRARILVLFCAVFSGFVVSANLAQNRAWIIILPKVETNDRMRSRTSISTSEQTAKGAVCLCYCVFV